MPLTPRYGAPATSFSGYAGTWIWRSVGFGGGRPYLSEWIRAAVPWREILVAVRDDLHFAAAARLNRDGRSAWTGWSGRARGVGMP